MSYKGIFFDPQDYSVHLSMIRAGMQGDWAYQFRFTTEPHTAAYTRLFYITLGQINRLLQLDPVILFEAARWLFGALALFSLYKLMGSVFKDIYWKRVAFLLAVFGSGLGWLQLLLGWIPGPITPVDLWLIDAYFFFSIALFPHFSLVIALLCLSIAFYLEFLIRNDWKLITWICLFSFLVQFVNPIAFVLVDIVFISATLTIFKTDRNINWIHLIALGVIAASQLPLLFYNYYLLVKDPIWSQFTQQNQTLSPPFIYYLWGFGLFWPLATIGMMTSIRKTQPVYFAALTWIITGFVLSYLPFNIQRRFLLGITIPLAILAVQGLQLINRTSVGRWPGIKRYSRRLMIVVIFIISFSSILLDLGRSSFLLTKPDEFFYPASLNSALVWLQENASPNDFVLSSSTSGQLIAQKTDLRVYLGHPMETLNYDLKTLLVLNFFRKETNNIWLNNTKVKWIFYGPYERNYSKNIPFINDGMYIVFRSEDVIIFRVKD